MKNLTLFLLCLLALPVRAQLITATTAECATSIDGTVVGTPNPLNKPTLSAVYLPTFGLAPGNYYVVIAWYDANANVTLASPEATFQLSAQGMLGVAPPAGRPLTAVGMQVFIGTTSGSETLQGQSTGTYTQNAPLVTGVAPPTVNNTVCSVVANDAGWPTGTGYQMSLTDPSGRTAPGYPLQVQLLGPGNTINIGNGLPIYNGTTTYPSPILSKPYGHGTQSISGPLSMGGYPITNVGAFNPSSVTSPNLDNLRIIDGVHYPSTAAGIQAAHNDLPATGGTIIIPPGTYPGTAGLNFSKNVVLQCVGRDATTIQLTTAGNSVQGITTTANLVISHCGLLGPSSGSNLFQKAIDLDTAAIGGGPHLQLIVDDVKIRGFNIGVFADGRGSNLTSFNIDQFVVKNSDILLSSVPVPAGGSNNAIFVAGSNSAIISDNDALDNNSVGDHVIYAIQNKTFIVKGNRIQNTTGAGSCGIKADMQTPNGSGTYPLWSITNNAFFNLSTGILIAPSDTAVIGETDISGNSFASITDTSAEKWGIQLNATQTSTLAHVVIHGNKFSELAQGAILLDNGSGTTTRSIEISDDLFYNFSTAVSGVDAAISASSAATYANVILSGVRADGNSTGRAAYDFTGASITRLQVLDSSEINITNASAPTPNLIVNGTITLPTVTKALSTTTIGAHTCSSAQTVTMTGVTTSSVISWSFAATPIGVTGYGDATTPFLVVTTFPTANTGNVVVCNVSGSGITPGAISVNLRAIN